MFVNQFDFVIFLFFFLDKSLGSFTLLRVIFAAMVIGDFGWSHHPTYRCIHVRYLVTTRTHVWVCFVPNYNFHAVGDKYCKTPHCACNLQASVRCAQTQSFRFDRAFRIERQWWASWSSWDKTLISLGLENTGLIIFSASGNKVYLCESMSDKSLSLHNPRLEYTWQSYGVETFYTLASYQWS